jgi:ABC-type tungstate transport system permease subunit
MIDGTKDVLTVFSKLFQGADAPAANQSIPVRFLSRYDKSATNIKEAELFLKIGQIPWALPYSTWYHQYPAFPLQALTASADLKEYTLTDRGTYLSLPSNVASRLRVYKAATDNEDDLLLNPARLLIGTKTQSKAVAEAFAAWATGAEGQKVITDFKKNGEQLYSGAP